MSGGKGNDTYIVDNVGDTLFENGDIHSTPQNESEGFDTVLTSVSFNVGLYSEIEVLQATGSANVNLTGSLDNNIIIGNSGTNIIDGSYGKDTLTGGGGLDVFIWSNINEIGTSNFDPDIVTDLNRAEGDLLMRTRRSPATRTSPSSGLQGSRRRARSTGSPTAPTPSSS